MPISAPNAANGSNGHDRMNIQVAGRHVDLGEALRTRIIDELNASLGKYFERGGSAEVTVSKDR